MEDRNLKLQPRKSQFLTALWTDERTYKHTNLNLVQERFCGYLFEGEDHKIPHLSTLPRKNCYLFVVSFVYPFGQSFTHSDVSYEIFHLS